MTFISRLHSHSLDRHPQGPAVKRILSAALTAADPALAVERQVVLSGRALRVGGREYDLSGFRRIYLLAVGKAAPSMAQALLSILGGRVAGGLLVAKHAPPAPLDPLTVFTAGHPVPDARSLRAGRQALDLLGGMTESDLVICLISGGGSALLTAPVDGVSLADMQALTAALLGCGASIDEINTLRRHLDRVKGGGLARAAAPARVIGLLLSDVVASPLEAIASGPTAPDPTTSADALAVLERYDLRRRAPGSVLSALEGGRETPKPGDALFARVQNLVVGSNAVSAQAALSQAGREGFHARLLTTALQGEAARVGRDLAAQLRQAASRPLCLGAGGETTVTLGEAPGRGGRNQELALAAVSDLAGLPGVMLVTLATDGEDGPTDAAGAVVAGETLARAQALGLAPDDYLRRHDAYAFFDALGDLLKPGPTGTNVNDLTFLFAF